MAGGIIDDFEEQRQGAMLEYFSQISQVTNKGLSALDANTWFNVLSAPYHDSLVDLQMHLRPGLLAKICRDDPVHLTRSFQALDVPVFAKGLITVKLYREYVIGTGWTEKHLHLIGLSASKVKTIRTDYASAEAKNAGVMAALSAELPEAIAWIKSMVAAPRIMMLTHRSLADFVAQSLPSIRTRHIDSVTSRMNAVFIIRKSMAEAGIISEDEIEAQPFDSRPTPIILEATL